MEELKRILRNQVYVASGSKITKEVFTDDFKIGVFVTEHPFFKYEKALGPVHRRYGINVIRVMFTAVTNVSGELKSHVFFRHEFEEHVGLPQEVKNGVLPSDYVFSNEQPFVVAKIDDKINNNRINFWGHLRINILYDLIKKEVVLNENDVPNAPKEIIPRILSKEERDTRINDWNELLKKLPYCDFVCDLARIKDDLEEIPAKLILSCSLDEGEDYRNDNGSMDFCFIELFFCFFNDGTFKVIKDDSLPLPSSNVAKVLSSHVNDVADSWEKGYSIIIKILEEAFSFSVPEAPKN